MTMHPRDDGLEAACTEVDVLVIGAGPAGAAAATTIARGAGRASTRVWLVERSTWPRRKVCGCCLSPAGVEMVVRHDLVAWTGRDATSGGRTTGGSGVVSGAGSRMPGVSPVDRLLLRVGGGDAQERTIEHRGGWAIGRDVLDDAMVRRARACGVRFFARVSASVRRRERGRWVVELMHHADTGAYETSVAPWLREIRARIVIVADGLNGSALRRLQDDPRVTGLDGLDLERLEGLAPTIAHGSWMGVSTIGDPANLQVSAPPLGTIAMHVGSGGYVGVVGLGVPSGSDKIAIGAALDPHAVRAHGGPVPLMRSILHVAAGDRATHWDLMGTGLLTRKRRTISLPGLMVVGDAAGYVEPFTGEGMTWAISAGVRAGGLGLEALRDASGARLELLARTWPALQARTTARRQFVSMGVRVLAHRPDVLGLLVGTKGPRPIGRALGGVLGIAASSAIRRPYDVLTPAGGGVASGGVA